MPDIVISVLMSTLDIIKKPLEQYLDEYEKFMRASLDNDNEFVGNVIDYVVSNRGKGIRPILSMLHAGVYSDPNHLGDRNFLAAMIVEMVHTASLVHDDVVDAAALRRGKPTVNVKWNSRVSVLMGDYILARSFSVGMESKHYDIVAFITKHVSALAEGELIQNDSSKHLSMTREKYLDIIYKKTATLMGASAGAGAMSSGASEEQIEMAWHVGLNMGMAFQIKDDILDYASQEQTGKPFCADLREHKITLPLLTVLERCDEPAQRMILSKIEMIDDDPEQINHLYELVVKENGIEESKKVMHEYIDRAREIVLSYPESEYRASLIELCDYIGARDK